MASVIEYQSRGHDRLGNFPQVGEVTLVTLYDLVPAVYYVPDALMSIANTSALGKYSSHIRADAPEP